MYVNLLSVLKSVKIAEPILSVNIASGRRLWNHIDLLFVPEASVNSSQGNGTYQLLEKQYINCYLGTLIISIYSDWFIHL